MKNLYEYLMAEVEKCIPEIKMRRPEYNEEKIESVLNKMKEIIEVLKPVDELNIAKKEFELKCLNKVASEFDNSKPDKPFLLIVLVCLESCFYNGLKNYEEGCLK